MVRDLVHDDAPDLAAEPVRVAAVESLERAAVDADLVGEDAAVPAPAPRERDALVEAEQRLARRRLLLDDDLDVRHRLAQVGGKGVEGVLDELLELVHYAVSSTSTSGLRETHASRSRPPPMFVRIRSSTA